eukprot:scaffold1054_cov124-Cylindrotheca_fusiformis.AAC.11
MSGSAMISRQSRLGSATPPSSSPRQRQSGGQAMTCNRCRKPLSTTVFVVACNCVFCEECTYSHFQSSANCPCCNRVLSENDFTELVVADPTAKNSSAVASFQNIFTKQNPQSQSLSFQDLCANIMKRNDDLRASTKFLMKQFLLESSKQNARSSQTIKLLEKLRQENTTLKQTQNSQRMNYEQAIEKLQQQLQSAQQKLDEKEQQIVQFRRLHASGRGPTSPHDRGPRRVSGAGFPPTPSGHMQSQPKPPIQGFMIQKEAEERAKQRVLESPQVRRPIIGSHENSNPPPSHVLGDGYHGTRLETPQRPYSGGTVGSGGIRNITSSSGFAFSGGIHKKRRSSSGGISPSQAFVNQSSAGYSGRSPSSAFQNRGYSQRQY